MAEITVNTFRKRKNENEKLVMVTAYDALGAAAAYEAGIDILLAGDSMANTALGYDSTLPLSMEEALFHTAAVKRGAPNAFVIFDMPFMSYQIGDEEALRNAARAIKEVNADAVKLEGGADYAPLISKMVNAGIPVMAHIGLLPQKVKTSGGYRAAGKTEDAARQLLEDARKVEEAGAFSVVLECMPSAVASEITGAISIPTIGIGSGAGCSGQVQVLTDVLGLSSFTPRHAHHYAELGMLMRQALKSYADEVRQGEFPRKENSF